MKRIIINADDFGLTPGINRGIVEAHQNGVLTSTTLMSGAPAFEDAILQARQNPDLGVGCHVVLVDGTPLLPAHRVSSLLHSGSSRFPFQLKVVIAKAMAGRLDVAQLEGEITEQIHFVQRAGIEVTHVDTHKHSHWVPEIFLPLIRAASRCGVRAIRNPFPASAISFLDTGGSLGTFKSWVKQRLLAGYARQFMEAADRFQMHTTRGVLGVFEPFFEDAERFSEALSALDTGTWELVTHPAYCDSALNSVKTVLKQERERQLSFLTTGAVRKILKEQDWERCSFRDLTRTSLADPPITSRNVPLLSR